jgi:hypothetical protein
VQYRVWGAGSENKMQRIEGPAKRTSVSVIETLAKQLAVEILREFRPHCADRTCFVGGLSSRHKRLIREVDK